MTTLDTRTGATSQTTTAANTTDTAAVITEQQVLFSSAAVLAPAPARRHAVVYGFTSAVRAIFARPEKPRRIKHYPQRFGYLENSAMSRQMARL
ncbi:hypothetical protein [Mycobacterium sp. 1274761.0]|uniref:hypothetical protein n=1 Tax=Mycobacterium sp. 1274761.0 TaxID=1834077 RepID=UPI000B1D8F94|nr:hypothetical protein [Mycobacterium sp. 1274761.0]